MIIVVMGVSGCGKTTIGKRLAKELGLTFHDADDYHPKRNIEKMQKGLPLDDSDRLPWLQILSGLMNIWNEQGGAILACSALKESYRRFLHKEVTGLKWIYLKGTRQLIAERLANRKDHFFDPKLLDSQFEAIEEPDYGVHIDINQGEKDILEELLKIFK